MAKAAKQKAKRQEDQTEQAKAIIYAAAKAKLPIAVTLKTGIIEVVEPMKISGKGFTTKTGGTKVLGFDTISSVCVTVQLPT